MEKYHLTDKSLQSVFKKLTDATGRQIAFLQLVKEAKQRIAQKGFDLSAERQAQASSTNQSEKESEKHLQRGLLLPKRLINAKKILADIKAGMNDAGLMEKYRLTEKGVQSVFKKLVHAGELKQGNRRKDHLSLKNPLKIFGNADCPPKTDPDSDLV